MNFDLIDCNGRSLGALQCDFIDAGETVGGAKFRRFSIGEGSTKSKNKAQIDLIEGERAGSPRAGLTLWCNRTEIDLIGAQRASNARFNIG